MPYVRSATRVNPACIVFLLDESGSMAEPFTGTGTQSKRDGLERAINSLLFNLVLMCDKDPSKPPRGYYDIGVIGYGSEIRSAFGGPLTNRKLVSITEIAMNPIDPTEAKWVEPRSSGRTPMGQAFNLVGQIVSDWAASHHESFPPIVINISDGAATDDPEVWAERLTSIRTSDGNLLLFNLNLSSHTSKAILFPADDSGLGDEFAKRLFAMSSPLTMRMRTIADAPDGSRGFGFNADFDTLVSFLQTGTQVGTVSPLDEMRDPKQSPSPTNTITHDQRK